MTKLQDAAAHQLMKMACIGYLAAFLSVRRCGFAYETHVYLTETDSKYAQLCDRLEHINFESTEWNDWLLRLVDMYQCLTRQKAGKS